MNVRTNLQAGQSSTVDVEKLTALVKSLDCQVSPMEMIGLAQKHCKNITADKVAAILEAAGTSGGPAGLLSIFGG